MQTAETSSVAFLRYEAAVKEEENVWRHWRPKQLCRICKLYRESLRYDVRTTLTQVDYTIAGRCEDWKAHDRCSIALLSLASPKPREML